tara:strand:+ start:832 stop:1416 length:585 start_codon:yes stop_codon:yes gene_type:complete
MCGRFTLRNVDTLKSKYGEIDFEPSYNLAPGNSILMLTDQLKSINWSFTPYWADKPFNLINARSETLNSKPSFENSNRCLIPADGWYEWKSEEDEKIPYFHHADGDIFFFAGVYGGYRGKLGCAIVTMEALETTKEIHERMPLIVARSHFKEWLEGSDSNSFDEAMVKSIKHHRVSTHVNNPTNNDPKCIFPTS